MDRVRVDSAPQIDSNNAELSRPVTFERLDQPGPELSLFNPGNVHPSGAGESPRLLRTNEWGDLGFEEFSSFLDTVDEHLYLGRSGGSATVVGPNSVAYGDGISALEHLLEEQREGNKESESMVAYVAKSYVAWCDTLVLTGQIAEGVVRDITFSVFVTSKSATSFNSVLEDARDHIGTGEVPSNTTPEDITEYTALEARLDLSRQPDHSLSPIAAIQKETGSAAPDSERFELSMPNPYFDESDELLDSLEIDDENPYQAEYEAICENISRCETMRGHPQYTSTPEIDEFSPEITTYELAGVQVVELPGGQNSPINVQFEVAPETGGQ